MTGLDFSILTHYWSWLAMGAAWTAIISVAGGAISVSLGLILAAATVNLPRIQRLPLDIFQVVFMGTPLLLQLFFIYYGLIVIGIDIPAIWAGIVGLGLHFAVYNADVFRAGIASLDRGQPEAARSLGFGQWRTLRHFVLPQAVHNTMPAIGSNMIALLKESAVVSALGIAELVQAAQRAISETYRPFEFYIAIAAIYYLLNIFLEVGLRVSEKRAERLR